jgi:hypothetical protein
VVFVHVPRFEPDDREYADTMARIIEYVGGRR